MEFSDTFVPDLYAVKFPVSEELVWNTHLEKYFSTEDFGNLDELERNTELWDNTEYLYDFFHEHSANLQSKYWQNISVEEAVLYTRDCADELNNVLHDCDNCELIFQTLTDGDLGTTRLKFHKIKVRRNCLRLYAIKLEEGQFVITGGTIKLTQKMQECPHNLVELVKLDKVKNFLISKDVFDKDSFESYMFELN